MSEILLVVTTFETEQDGQKMAELLVRKRLAACAQISSRPITSFYWWKGKIENSSEVVLSIKTSIQLYEQLEKTIKENHPYETPEIVATPVSHHSSEYGEWLMSELKQS